MRFLRGLVGGVLGGVPGVALIPVLEFFALVIILLGIVAGAMIGAAPKGRRRMTALGSLVGVVAGTAVAMMPGGFGLLLAPVVVFFGGWIGMHGADSGRRPTAEI